MAKTYLVVGAAPHEDRQGRTFYDKPSVFLLDKRPHDYYYAGEAPKKGIDFSRYAVVNFTDVAAMDRYSRENENKFDMILFDVAVVKFFEGNLSSLPFFWKMLKPGGQLIMDANVYSGLPWMQFWKGHPNMHSANFNERLRAQIPAILSSMQEFVLKELRALPYNRIESITYRDVVNKDPILTDVYRIAKPAAHVFVVNKLSLPNSPNENNIDIVGGHRKRRYRKKISRKTKRKQRR